MSCRLELVFVCLFCFSFSLLLGLLHLHPPSSTPVTWTESSEGILLPCYVKYWCVLLM